MQFHTAKLFLYQVAFFERSLQHYPALHLFKLYRKMGYREGMFPHAERFGASTVTLPLFTQMTREDVARVCNAVDDICTRYATGR